MDCCKVYFGWACSGGAVKGRPPGHLPDAVREVWLELARQVPAEKRGVEFEALCSAVARLRDAQLRIAREGAIVADGKGHPVPHPALKIEAAASEAIRKLNAKFRC